MSEEQWFRMRPSKFMAGCRGLNANEVKVYISLICRIMEHGAPVEDDAEILATYCEVRPSSFAAALDRLIRLKKIIRTEDGRLSNALCDGEIAWRAGYSENQKRAGQKSAEKRQQKQTEAATGVERTFSQKKKKEIEKEIREEKNPPTPQGGLVVVDASASEFEKVWPHYPRHVGKAAASKAWTKARRRATYAEIAEPLKACIRAWSGTPPDKIPHFATWLNRDGWLDDPGHAANRPRTGAEDVAHLSRVTAADDVAGLFAGIPQLRIAR